VPGGRDGKTLPRHEPSRPQNHLHLDELVVTPVPIRVTDIPAELPANHPEQISHDLLGRILPGTLSFHTSQSGLPAASIATSVAGCLARRFPRNLAFSVSRNWINSHTSSASKSSLP